MPHREILVFFFIIAFIYTSVGFGGGSSYLSILALSVYAFPVKEIRIIALICNIIVVTGGTLIFIKHRQVNWKKILPVILVSVPMAFLGATIKLSQDTFFVILGCSLIVAAVLLWIKTRRSNTENIEPARKYGYIKDGLTGGAIGFLSGMVSIGGGIFLSPLLNLKQWDMRKRIAATASIFILVNSIAGIVGQLTNFEGCFNYTRIGLLCVAVFLGGQLGSRMGAIKFNPLVI